ncbi:MULTISPECIES: DUF5988 family protein [Streptomyces]|uniref:Uncharacterized protein n=2 Tax=Streptomyces TaxID=1883 RepID=A0ABT9L407_9ACTN|nr:MULTISPECIES: DUF5988 family protein [Streptomyces]MBW8092184.1 hypothetical protein [Streptomyces hygroscopicus subsp. hygroscopicus]MCO8301685.1 DUF5988 family protein [Streptomyces sp. RKCA744]MDN3060692.1 DUF5988 family protein [Streptomyces sp. SRF1]MDP9615445.1 hypothetical protein [Streptomyces demainii]GHJ33348.1 hypothetical protein TPA0910_77810 [Streptomyces hygroscopicus]
MSDHTSCLSDGSPIEVVLEGGPDDLPRAVRTGRSTLTTKKLKIPHRNGYEHFELVNDAADITPAIFRWTMRTKIAE